MVEHMPYHGTTNPKITVAQWDSLLSKLETSASFIVRKNGAYYEALKGGTSSNALNVIYGGSGNNGATDGSNAADVINTTITAVNEGDAIFLKNGLYNVGATGITATSKRFSLIGENPQMKSDGSYGATLYSTEDVTFLTLDSCTDTILQNISIMGDNRTHDQNGIFCTTSDQRIKFYDVLVGYCLGYGLKTTGNFWDCAAVNLWVHKCGDAVNNYESMYFDASAADFHCYNLRNNFWRHEGMYNAGNDMYFTNCQFHGDPDEAKLPNITLNTGGQNHFHGCMFNWAEPHLEINCAGNKIIGNHFQNNDTCAIDINTGHLNKILGNTVRDVGGMTLDGDYNIVCHNEFEAGGTVTVTGTGNIVKDNTGEWVSENQGTGAILSGNTNVYVTHGLSAVPALQDVTIVGGENPTNDVGTIWADDFTATGNTQFRVNCENDPGASNFTFGWRAKCRP